MNQAASILPDLEALNPSELKALIVEQHKQLTTQEERILSHDEQLAWRAAEIERLKLLLAKLRRTQFGRSSERVNRQIEQLELRRGELEQSRALEVELPKAVADEPVRHDRRDCRCLRICGVKSKRTCRNRKLARTAEES